MRIDDANGAFTDTTPTQINGEGGADALIGGTGDERLNGGAGSDIVEGAAGEDDVDLGGGGDTVVWQPGPGNELIRGGAGATRGRSFGSDDEMRSGFAPRNPGPTFARGRRGRAHPPGHRTRRRPLHKRQRHAAAGYLTGTGIRTVEHDEANSPDGTSADAGNDRTIVRGTQADHMVSATGPAPKRPSRGSPRRLTHRWRQHPCRPRDPTLGVQDSVRASRYDGSPAKLTVDAGTDDDTLSGSPVNDLLKGGGGADTIKGGDGNDTIEGDAGADNVQGGAGDDHFSWSAGDGNDTVLGQSGHTQTPPSPAPMPENGSTSLRTVTAFADRIIAHIALDINRVETVELNRLGGADRVFVHSLVGTDVRNTKIDLSSTSGETDLQPDTITVDGTDKRDVIGVRGSHGEAHVFPFPSGGVLDITHADASLDRLTIRGRGGRDTIFADGLSENGGLHADAIGLQIDGGDGNDGLVGGDGDDIIFGGDGGDIIGWPRNDTRRRARQQHRDPVTSSSSSPLGGAPIERPHTWAASRVAHLALGRQAARRSVVPSELAIQRPVRVHTRSPIRTLLAVNIVVTAAPARICATNCSSNRFTYVLMRIRNSRRRRLASSSSAFGLPTRWASLLHPRQPRTPPADCR